MNSRTAPPPVGALADALDPWTHQRAWWGGYSLLRIIDLDAGTDEFVVLRPKGLADFRDLEWNGRTLILPERARTLYETAEILGRADERYRAAPPNPKTTRLSAVDRERALRS